MPTPTIRSQIEGMLPEKKDTWDGLKGTIICIEDRMYNSALSDTATKLTEKVARKKDIEDIWFKHPIVRKRIIGRLEPGEFEKHQNFNEGASRTEELIGEYIISALQDNFIILKKEGKND